MAASRMRFKYNSRTKEFTVHFKDGTTSIYLDVPQGVAQQALEAVSKGQFFNAYIRDDYERK